MKTKNTILIIDDEKGIRDSLSAIFEDEGETAIAVEDAVEGLKVLETESVGIIFLDVMLPKMGGIEALEKIKAAYPEVEVIMISGHANIDIAVRAVKTGAFDFLEKPLSIEKVLVALRNAENIRDLREENIELKKKRKNDDEIVGKSAAISKVRDLIHQAAATDVRILITGENGTGKELVARAVHQASKRSASPFVAVNCAAIPDTLIESELFGHEKGAFTDASSMRKGRFELAAGGTLFLDEIADMSLSAQAKVLRVIQEQKLERLGGEKTITVNTRIIAATNKNLEEECKNNRFREDLFFRLNVVPIYVPALRERKEDIIPILRHFLCQKKGANMRIDGEAETMLTERAWHGNVRELKNIAERISLFLPDTDDAVLDRSILLSVFEMEGSAARETPPASVQTGQPGIPSDIIDTDYNRAKALFEKRYLEYHLAKNGGALTKTAASIGMFPSNLHLKLRKAGLI
jgi:two-component system nitrogen regulation response regulator NtrX